MSIFGDIFGYLGAGKAAGTAATGYKNAKQGLADATSGANGQVIGAGDSAKGLVDARTGDANATLQSILDQIKGNTNPYVEGGQQGIAGLSDLVNNKPTFSFNPSDLQNDPGYQFQLQQGNEAIQNSASKSGLVAGGNTLKELTKYGQGLAGTYFDQAFNRAKSTFDTNENTTLANLTALTGSGLSGTAQQGQALQNIGGQQAQNTVNSGFYGGNVDTSLAQFLASLNVNSAKQQGDYEIGSKNALAAGTLGKYNNLSGLATDIGTTLANPALGLVH